MHPRLIVLWFLLPLAAGCARGGFFGPNELSGGDSDSGEPPTFELVCGADPTVNPCAGAATAGAHDAIGAGTVSDPWVICTAAQLAEIGNHPEDWDASFALRANLDLAGYDETNLVLIGSDDLPFTGTFNGCGHTIDHFSFTETSRDPTGLFRFIYRPGTAIRNLHLLNADVDGLWDVGTLVGHAGIGSVITNCSATGAVRASEDVGGLVGSSFYTRISACRANVAVDAWSDSLAAGLVGNLVSSRVEHSYAEGTVSARSGMVGGLAGGGYQSRIIDSYATGDVSTSPGGDDTVGGLAGRTYHGEQLGCFATGTVSGDSVFAGVGPMVGSGADYVDSYYDESVACTNRGTGLVCNTSGDEINGTVSPNYFFDANNPPMAGWDFTGTWEAVNDGYPRLVPTVLNRDTWGDCGEHTSDSPFAGGNGTLESPYLICAAAQLDNIGRLGATDPATYWQDVHYRLEADIGMSAYDGTTSTYHVIGSFAEPFNGSFDGNGFEIRNLTHHAPAVNHVGLFGHTGENTMLVDVRLEDVDISGSHFVGALAASIYNSSVLHCSASGMIAGDEWVGGLVGFADSENAGGLDRTDIRLSSSSATVTGLYNVGGLVGGNGGNIADSFATGPVSGGTKVGGLVGDNSYYDSADRNIEFSYATGAVSGDAEVGGLVGVNGQDSFDVLGCFAVGAVTGSPGGPSIGPLVGTGDAIDASLYDCNSSCVECDNAIGECVDLSADPGYFFAPVNPPMASWNFEFIWEATAGGYPVLR